MKHSFPIASLLFGAGFFFSLQAQIFWQDFSSSTFLPNYVSGSPNARQFNEIGPLTTARGATITRGVLQFERSGYATRTTDFNPSPTALKVIFDIAFSGNTATTPNAFSVSVGSEFPTGLTNPANGNTYARLSFDFTSLSGVFKIRDVTNNGVGRNSYYGNQTMSWFLNNSRLPLTYTAPDGSLENLAGGKADIWIGTVREFDDVNVQSPSVPITDLKFLLLPGTTATARIDNIVINDETMLPVHFASFGATSEQNMIFLRWATTSETDCAGFDVERSTETSPWQQIAHVRSRSMGSYGYDDLVFGEDVYWYRLRQCDRDGSYHYSQVIHIRSQTSSEKVKLLRTYPNPFNPVTSFELLLQEPEHVTLTIHDMLGRPIAVPANELLSAGLHTIPWNAGDRPSGVYLYTIITRTSVKSGKIVLQR
jgi:hypothetical protein